MRSSEVWCSFRRASISEMSSLSRFQSPAADMSAKTDPDSTTPSMAQVFNPFDHDPAGAPGEPYRPQAPAVPDPTPTPTEQPEAAAGAAPALNEPPNAVITGDPALSLRIVEMLRSCYRRGLVTEDEYLSLVAALFCERMGR